MKIIPLSCSPLFELANDLKLKDSAKTAAHEKTPDSR